VNDVELWKLLGQGGAVLVLCFIVWRIGERLIASLDRVGVKTETFGERINAHTTASTAMFTELRQDLAESTAEIRQGIATSTAELRQSIAIVDTRMQQFTDDWADQLTPVGRQRYEDHHLPPILPDVPRAPTPRQPVSRPADPDPRQTGEYSMRPPTDNGRGRRR